MISIALAQELQRHGLEWNPQLFDFFAIPGHGLDDRIFVLSDLTIDVQTLAGHSTITFNGVAEWSLDYILSQDTVWLPTEEQLRRLLGDQLVGLYKNGTTHRVEIRQADAVATFEADDASDAYGRALLSVLAAADKSS